MLIKSLKIENYRKLDETYFKFDEKSNYLVGKNNIGKTSTLNLLETVLTGRNFQLDDFNDPQKPIAVKLEVKISEEETGIFDDNFSPRNSNEISITCKQMNAEEQLKYTHYETKSDIYASQIKKSNLISYSSNIKPIRQKDLVVDYGDYKLIPTMVKTYLTKHEPSDSFNINYDKSLPDYLNSNLKKILPFKEGNVGIAFASDYSEIVAGLMVLEDEAGVEFSKLGFGLQFSTLIPLKIIDQIIKWKRYNKLEDHLICNSEGEKILNVILTVDEPEVHLYPNLQLKLINYIKRILNGDDNSFNNLLKELFNISKIIGQLFVVTHSPYILPNNNYNEIIRLAEENKKVLVTSGMKTTLDSSEKKQLKRNSSYIASSLFADSIIIVEGDTEEAAFEVFANKLEISLVENNTNIVKADGIKSVFPLSKLFSEFKIKNFLVIDRDKKEIAPKSDEDILEEHKKYIKRSDIDENVFITDQVDFEYECYKCMTLRDINHYLCDFEKIINQNDYDGSFWFKVLGEEHKNEIINASNVPPINTIDNILESLSAEEEAKIKEKINETSLMKKYFKAKSSLNGKLIAENTSSVPLKYKMVIKKATEKKDNN